MNSADGGIPSPNGGAWVAIITGPYDDWYEYIGRALTTPLAPGQYNMVVDLGAPADVAYTASGDQTLDIVAYGLPSASSLPFAGTSTITTAGIGAVELGRVRVTLLESTWQTDVVIPLTIPSGSSFEYLAIGGDNVDPTTGAVEGITSSVPSYTQEYTLIDNIRLTNNFTTCTCNITDVDTMNVSACNDNGTPKDDSDDIFTADVVVTFENAPTTGTLDITGDVSSATTIPVSSLPSSAGVSAMYTFIGVEMAADGTMKTLQASFSAESCPLSNTVMAPSSCATPCNTGTSGGPRFLTLLPWVLGGLAVMGFGYWYRRRLSETN